MAWGFVIQTPSDVKILVELLVLSQNCCRKMFWNRLTFPACQVLLAWCLANSEILEKVLKQHEHWYFFISEWVWTWARRLDRSAKARLQWRHENGFSPEEATQRFKSFIDTGWIFLFWETSELSDQSQPHSKQWVIPHLDTHSEMRQICAWGPFEWVSQPSFMTWSGLDAVRLWWTGYQVRESLSWCQRLNIM